MMDAEDSIGCQADFKNVEDDAMLDYNESPANVNESQEGAAHYLKLMQ